VEYLETLYETESLTERELFETLSERLNKLGRKINLFMQSVEKEHLSKK